MVLLYITLKVILPSNFCNTTLLSNTEFHQNFQSACDVIVANLVQVELYISTIVQAGKLTDQFFIVQYIDIGKSNQANTLLDISQNHNVVNNVNIIFFIIIKFLAYKHDNCNSSYSNYYKNY